MGSVCFTTVDDIMDVNCIKRENDLVDNNNKETSVDRFTNINEDEFNNQLAKIKHALESQTRSKPITETLEFHVKEETHPSDLKLFYDLEIKDNISPELKFHLHNEEAVNERANSVQPDLNNVKIKIEIKDNETLLKSKEIKYVDHSCKKKETQLEPLSCDNENINHALHTELLIKDQPIDDDGDFNDGFPDSIILKNLKVMLKQLDLKSLPKLVESKTSVQKPHKKKLEQHKNQLKTSVSPTEQDLAKRNPPKTKLTTASMQPIKKKLEKIEELKSKLSFYKVLEKDKVEEMTYAIYKCDKCDFVTIEQSGFKEHLETHGDGKFKCKLCKFETPQESSFKAHINSCIEDSLKKKTYSCKTCQYETFDKEKYKLHIKKHKDKSLLKCSICPYEVKTRTHLNQHMRRVHIKSDSLWRCRECEFSSNYKVTILRHEKNIHNIGKLKEFKCDLCDYTSIYTSNASRHKKMVHGDNFIFSCDQCNFQTKYKDHIEPHVRHHLNLEAANFACDECDYKTVYRQNLLRHRTQVHMEPNEAKMRHCTFCDYKCRSSDSFQRHIKGIHANHDEQIKYKCKECSYFSSSKRYLKLHMMRLHLDPEITRRFTCNICDVSYITRQELNGHLLARHNLKKFYCAHCNAKFEKRTKIINHIWKKHQEVSIGSRSSKSG